MESKAFVDTALLMAPILLKLLFDYLPEIVEFISNYLFKKPKLVKFILNLVIGLVIVAAPIFFVYYLHIIKESAANRFFYLVVCLSHS